MVEIENAVETERTTTVGPSAGRLRRRPVEQIGRYFLYWSPTEQPAMVARLRPPQHNWLPVKPQDGEAGPTKGRWTR